MSRWRWMEEGVLWIYLSPSLSLFFLSLLLCFSSYWLTDEWFFFFGLIVSSGLFVFLFSRSWSAGFGNTLDVDNVCFFCGVSLWQGLAVSSPYTLFPLWTLSIPFVDTDGIFTHAMGMMACVGGGEWSLPIIRAFRSSKPFKKSFLYFSLFRIIRGHMDYGSLLFYTRKKVFFFCLRHLDVPC